MNISSPEKRSILKRSPRYFAVFCFAGAAALSGCTLNDVEENGDRCPPLDAAKDAVLAYVNTTECSSESTMCEYRDAFASKTCPIQYKHCMKDDELHYHCAESNSCPYSSFLCGDSCVNPKMPETCGILSDCTGGTACKDDESCVYNDGTYSCSKSVVEVCPEGSYSCDNKCVSPKLPETCGILSDCTGGTACKDDESCVPDAGGYKCTKSIITACPENQFQISDENGSLQCIDPTSDATCGATDSSNLGEKCSSDRKCEDGICKCREDRLDCDGKCVLQSDPQYCGITQDCTDEVREFTDCTTAGQNGQKYQCLETDGTYQCVLSSCPDDQNLCHGLCIDKSDPENCGSCDTACNKNHSNAGVGTCKEYNGSYSCDIQCPDNTTDCSSDPSVHICADLTSSRDNCGTCGHKCGDTQRCDNGSCIENKCKGENQNTCYLNGCTNTPEQCGPSCKKCGGDDVADYACTNGICHLKTCPKGQHNQYNTSELSAECRTNTITECAPPDNMPETEISNCSAKYPNAKTQCNDKGSCELVQCNQGYHLNSDKDGCTKNTSTACAGPDESSTTDCTKLSNIASTNEPTCGTSGKCVVSQCAANYHLSSDKSECVKNTSQSCAATKSSQVKDCTKISNIASKNSVTCSTSGKCVVSECAANYHLSSTKYSCAQNSNQSCGLTTSSTVYDCTSISNIASTSSAICDSSGKCIVSECKKGYELTSNHQGCYDPVPKADIIDVIFYKDGTAKNIATSGLTVNNDNAPKTYYSESLRKYVAKFDNDITKSAKFYYSISYENNKTVMNDIADGHSLEAFVSLGTDYAGPEEASIMSTWQFGGTGISVKVKEPAKNWAFSFSPNIGGGYKNATSTITPEPGKYYHVVGVWDKGSSKAIIYINGEQAATEDTGTGSFTWGDGVRWFCIGADPDPFQQTQFAWNGDIAIARVYSKPLTSDDVKELYRRALDPDFDPQVE